ncbi:lactonase family protein [Paenibacillus crassostreae]|uniref:3-carboxymuconate cyclase n=1 Tax=Paenibacillus crassostreae TaxID=1763538 RepID=A0A167FI49_9BACL|nr:lactonase family protein [Paenibacillus crassostreae]AOZ94383.1 3-carboxymuconate cyclase [Paenibacillus crassostreae]OAB76580.1 3-carboxymuconate cyclase [Paenibacillus crassostreae]
MESKSKELFVFVGSYAESADNGVYVYTFDEGKGQLKLVDTVAGLKNPTFLNVDADSHKLYAISESHSAEGNKIGEIVAFAIDSTSGALNKLDRKDSVQSTTCHIQRDSEGKFLIVTSYHGGMIGLISINEDGTLGEVLDVQQHEGHSVHPNQDRPHPHSSFFSPDGKFLFVQDLGLDIIQAYSLNSETQQLLKKGTTHLHPGAGPRHLTFHPNGKNAFVINELDSTITSFLYQEGDGVLAELETVPTLPINFTEENGCAEIVISQDGKFVYGSNRGHDSIVVYAFDEVAGKLTLVEHVSVEGQHPRHFAFTPKGDYLIVANRDTNNLTTFRVDQESGRLQYTGISVSVSKPVCVQPYYL